MRLQTDELVSTLPPLYLFLKHHACGSEVKGRRCSTKAITVVSGPVVLIYQEQGMIYKNKNKNPPKKGKGKAKALFGPVYFSLRDLLFPESLFL